MFFKMVVKWLLCNVEELILSHYNDPESQKSSGLFITNISTRLLEYGMESE